MIGSFDGEKLTPEQLHAIEFLKTLDPEVVVAADELYTDDDRYLLKAFAHNIHLVGSNGNTFSITTYGDVTWLMRYEYIDARLLRPPEASLSSEEPTELVDKSGG